jgi:hypothetical protein
MTETMEEKFTRGDRDMIITLNVKVDNIKEDIQKLNDTTLSRICILENRVDRLENYKSWVVGAFSLAGLLAALITYIYFSDINHIRLDLEKHMELTNTQ